MNPYVNAERKSRATRPRIQWWAGPIACLVTLLALPIQAAVVFPPQPLTTGNKVAPNILFILDDSGSMAWRNMNSQDISEVKGSGNFSSKPDANGVTQGTDINSESSGKSEMYMQSYVTNSLYYNPAVSYQTWMGADGNRVTGGTSYTAAYSEDVYITHAGSGTSSGTKNLSSKVQTFYVPKGSDLSKIDNYYRFQIIRNGDIERGVYGKVVATRSTTNSCDGDSNGSWGWIDCVSALPSPVRDLAQEKINFATWYSYHRTRTKAAKAGAADAFMPLDNKVRVGFRTIWDRSNFDIPVKDGNDGRFVDNDGVNGKSNTNSRSTWYNRLFAASAKDGTPLQNALNNAGLYFSDKGANKGEYGPYGPEAGSNQYSCRQNFSILTTDGYWNTSTAGTGNIDGVNATQVKGPNGKSYTYSATAPFKDGYGSTLADVAMKYWVTDLRTESYMGNLTQPDNNNVPISTADPAFWQHMVTFGISIGLKTTKGWSSIDDVPANPAWPDPDASKPKDDNPARIDDLLHAAVNGHGQFVAASSPEEFTSGLSKALAAIAERTSSFSNVATNSTSLNTGAKVFSASYVSGTWVGALKAYPVDRSGVSTAASWTASTLAFGARKNKVFTYTGTIGAKFPTTGTGAQQDQLDRSRVGVLDYPVTGAENANYIMGDQSGEGTATGKLRVRTSVLGDVVNSSPAYVQDSDTVYVGANDGMLHAFDARDGKELFAYIPNIIDFTKLAKLSRGDYDHSFFVDGPVVVTSKASWNSNKNILVGSLGRGGKGLFSLDVTNPGSFGIGNVKWEKNNGELGNVLGAPILAQVRGSSNGAVIVGNGPNSASDKAFLSVRNLSNGAIIREIPTDNTIGNGLSAPIGVYAADGVTVVYAYAGDMQGNVWKFDMTDASPSAWTATKIFHAEKTVGTPQPITSGLTVAVDPATRKRWIFFGTGSYLTAADADDRTASAQSMYGVIDDGGSYTRSKLTQRNVTVSGSYRYFDSKTALPPTSKGWYVDLPGNGERIVQNAQINGTFLVTASMMPVGDACEGSGSGFINAIDAFTGTSGGASMFDLDGDGVTDNAGAGGNPIGSANLGVGMPTMPLLLPGQVVLGGSGDGSAAGLGGGKTFGMSWQRVSWREIRKDD